MKETTCKIASTSKASYPNFPYETIKNTILGKKYEVSLIFIGETRAKSLNQKYRQKDYVPNVLSFPLDNMYGEIFICPQIAKKEASKFSLSIEGYIVYLFIHGLLHLKGLDHGYTMDKLEKNYIKKFNLV